MRKIPMLQLAVYIIGLIGIFVPSLAWAVVSITDYGATSGGANCTSAIATALAANDEILIPAGTWHVDTIAVTLPGKHIYTAGLSTIIQQRTGNVGTRVIAISASNTVVDTLKVIGNIATDTDEQNHGVFIYNASGSLSNVTIGDVYGEDLRGDVLYIGASTGNTSTQITFGTITGKNVLRNVVSITGGDHIIGTAVLTDTSTGYTTLDIEPNTVAVADVTIGTVTGAVLQIAPPTANTAARRITIGAVTLDPSLATDSTPSYASRNVANAVVIRNTIGLAIATLSIANHTGLGVTYEYSAGGLRGSGISIGSLAVSGVGSGESVYNAVAKFVDVDDYTIGSGTIALQSVNDVGFLGDSSGSTYTRPTIRNLTINGRVVNYARYGVFTNITATSTYNTSAFRNCNDCKIINSHISVPYAINSSTRTQFLNTYFIGAMRIVGSSSSSITIGAATRAPRL